MPKLAGPVELKIPAEVEYIHLAKRVAQSLGSKLGFSLEELDELTIAVAQACDSTIEAARDIWAGGAMLKLTYSPTDRGIAVDVEAVGLKPLPTRRSARQPATAALAPTTMAAPAPPPGHLDFQLLTQEMIRMFVDDFRSDVDRGRGEVRLRMVKYLIT